MEWKEALPLLQDNHTGVAISVTPRGHAQATVVSTAIVDSKIGFASPARTVKVKNILRTGRATVTVIKLDTRRYVTVEGPAIFEPWQDTPAHIMRLKDLYVASDRVPKEQTRNLPSRCGMNSEAWFWLPLSASTAASDEAAKGRAKIDCSFLVRVIGRTRTTNTSDEICAPCLSGFSPACYGGIDP